MLCWTLSWLRFAHVYSYFWPTCSFVHMRLTSYSNFLWKKNKKLVVSFNFTFCYIDDVLSLINEQKWWLCWTILSHELVIKDTTDTVKRAAYLDLHLEIGKQGQLKTKLCDKYMISTSQLCELHFLLINIPAAPALEVYISHGLVNTIFQGLFFISWFLW